MSVSPKKMTVGFANIAHTYTHLFLLLYPTVVLALEVEFDRPYGELLSLSLVGFILLGAGALPAGWLGDRWSAKGMMVVFFFGMGAAAIFTGFANSLFQIGAGLAAIGLFASIYHPVGLAMLVNATGSRGTSLGINGVFGNMGTAAGALVAGALTDLISWRAAFIVPGAVAMATGVAFLLLAPETKTVAKSARASAGAAEITRAVMVRAMVLLSITLLCNGMIYQMTSVALPKVFAERITGFAVGGALGIGGLVALVYLFSSLAQLAGGVLADRFPLKSVFIWAYLLQVPIFLAASVVSGRALVATSALLVSLNVGAAPAETSLIARYSPSKFLATAFGAKFAVALGVSALGIPLVALIFDRTGGFFWLYMVLALLAAITVGAALFLPPEGRRAPAGQQAADRPSNDAVPIPSESD